VLLELGSIQNELSCLPAMSCNIGRATVSYSLNAVFAHSRESIGVLLGTQD